MNRPSSQQRGIRIAQRLFPGRFSRVLDTILMSFKPRKRIEHCGEELECVPVAPLEFEAFCASQGLPLEQSLICMVQADVSLTMSS
jgi:hypothetical protein